MPCSACLTGIITHVYVVGAWEWRKTKSAIVHMKDVRHAIW